MCLCVDRQIDIFGHTYGRASLVYDEQPHRASSEEDSLCSEGPEGLGHRFKHWNVWIIRVHGNIREMCSVASARIRALPMRKASTRLRNSYSLPSRAHAAGTLGKSGRSP